MSHTATEYRDKLEKFVWRLVPMAEEGSDLIGIGGLVTSALARCCDPSSMVSDVPRRRLSGSRAGRR